jgi:hypothetical protein
MGGGDKNMYEEDGTDKKRSKKKGEAHTRVILNPAHPLAYAIMNRRVKQ